VGRYESLIEQPLPRRLPLPGGAGPSSAQLRGSSGLPARFYDNFPEVVASGLPGPVIRSGDTVAYRTQP